MQSEITNWQRDEYLAMIQKYISSHAVYVEICDHEIVN